MSSHQFTLPCPSDSFELLVDFDFQPYEAPERGPEAAYPGCPEAVTIEHVTLNGHDVTSLLSEAQLNELEAAVWDEINRLRDASVLDDYDSRQDQYLEPLHL